MFMEKPAKKVIKINRAHSGLLAAKEISEITAISHI